jgi:predicted ATPase
LAAARVQTLGLEQILERLDDSVRLLVGGKRTAPTRQQTLRATLDWSHDLLGDEERALFRRLAVFADSCGLDAVEAVCAAGIVEPGTVLDVLQRLVDKSLVVVLERGGDVRYRLLEPVRQYAAEHLVASGEHDSVRRRHALDVAAFVAARNTDTNKGGPRRPAATAELNAEYPNIQAALAWSMEFEETQLGLRLAANLLFLW